MKDSGGKRKKKIAKIRLKNSNVLIKTLMFFGAFLIAIGGLFSAKTAIVNIMQKKAAGEVPAHKKTITNNNDGTYKLSLNVTGDSEKKPQHANVIIIMDTSSSMTKATGNSSVSYLPNNDNPSNYSYNTRYGLIDGKYVALTRNYSGGSYHYYYNDKEYTDTRYQRQTNQTRIRAAKSAVRSLVSKLMDYNSVEGNDDDTIEMALIDFADSATLDQGPTKSKTSVMSYLDYNNGSSNVLISERLGSSGRGTNWESALKEANSINFNDTDPTYVIFVSDGNPTFRDTKNGTVNTTTGPTPWEDWNETHHAYGTGSDSDGSAQNIARCYSTALPVAKTLAEKYGVKNFYTIFAYGDTSGSTNMKNLTTGAGAPATNNYTAADTAQLQNAIDEILGKIEMSGINNAVITDGTTEAVKIETTDTNGMLVVDTNSFEYTITIPIVEGKASIRGQEATLTGNTLTWGDNKSVQGTVQGDNFIYKWTGVNDLTEVAPPPAEDQGGNVKWDLTSAGILINDATYTVSFDVWPSQETYDLVADLKNGTKDYEKDLSGDVKKYLTSDYILETNTGAVLSYNDTRNQNGTQTSGYDNPPDIGTDTSTISITKEWDNTTGDGRKDREINVNLQRDGENFYPATLNSSNNWSLSDVHISTGLARLSSDGVLTVLDTGHDYKFAELGYEAYNWELETETVHPMLINGSLKKLILVEDSSEIPSEMGSKDYYNGYYKLANGKIYKDAGANPTIHAINHRRSNLNINKVVDGASADPNQDFEFTINVTQKDKDNKVIADNPSTSDDDLWFSVYGTDGNKQLVPTPSEWTEYQDPNSGEYYYYAPNGTQLVVNLKAGDNLRFTNLVSNTDFSVVEKNTTNYTLESITTPSGFTGANDSKTINDKTITGHIGEDNTSYQVTYKNVYEKVNLSVEKEWLEDINDDVRPESITVDLLADGTKVEGKSVTLSDENSWKDDTKWKDLDRFKDGKEINYTVDEKTISDHYTTTYSLINPTPEKYTKAFKITNTRKEDDKYVNIIAKKIWDDAKNQDGIRPADVDFELKDKDGLVATITLDGTADQNGENKAWEALFYQMPKYKNGQLVTYTVEEKKTVVLTGIDGPGTYEIKTDGTYNDVITITNKHTPETSEATIKKVWSDANDQDGKRPTELKVTLSSSDPTFKSREVTLNAENNWTATEENLPKNVVGKVAEEAVYTWSEDEKSLPEGYTLTDTTVDGKITTLTNSRKTDETAATIKKVWDDASNQDGKRPTELKVTLTSSDPTFKSREVTLNEQNGWTATEENLPKNVKNQVAKEAVYTWTEDKLPEGYSLTDTTVDGKVTTITNTHTPGKVSVDGEKEWDDANDQDGIRPASIEVTLHASVDGIKDQTKVVTSATNWKYSFTGLDEYYKGEKVTYTVTEKEISDYKATIDGYHIKNTHKPETTSVNGNKKWIDGPEESPESNQDGLRPEKITVNLLADGTKIDSKEVKVAEDGTWSYSFTDLPKYKIVDGKGGVEIQYSVTEDKVSEYTSSVEGYDITNKHNPFETEVSVKKVWEDNNDIDGIRSDSITAKLMADGIMIKTATLNSSTDWEASWKNLPRRANGKDITYTIEELVVPEGYSSIAIKDDTTTETEDKTVYVDDEKVTVTNTHTPEVVDVFGEKVWDDANNQDGLRPASIKVNLLSDGSKIDERTITEQDEWKFSFEGLPKYKIVEGEGGNEIEYTVTEEFTTNPEGQYTTVINGSVEEGFTITNTHTPELTRLDGMKIWDDANDQDGIRPAAIVVNLLEDGEVIDNQTVTAANNWAYSFENLPVYKVGKVQQKVTYTVEEAETPKEYTATVEGNNIKNTHTPELTRLDGKKVWDDANDQDGVRPDSITVNVKDGDTIVRTITVTGDEKADEWSYAVENLPKYKIVDGKGGNEIKYTVEEILSENDKKNYTPSILGTTITNTHEPAKVDVPASKTWIDNSNSESKRPTEISLSLKADGEVVRTETIKGDGNTWTYTFEGLPKFRDQGTEIKYTVVENNVDKNYDVSYPEDRVVINTIKDLERDIPVTKIWDDANNQDGKRPEELVVNLVGTVPNGEGNLTVYEDSITLSGKESTWTGKFEKAPIFYKGTLISYTINEEIDDANYPTTSIVGDVKEGYEITNTHTPEKTTVTAKKVWDDADNNDGMRPESITVALKVGEEILQQQTVTATDDWTVTFTDLDKYKDGKEIEYKVDELNVDENYKATIDTETRTITNTHTPLTITYEITKIWDDYDNQDGKRPESITVNLFADGTKAQSVTIKPDENGDWYYKFENLPKYKEGKLIQYTITEDTVELYETEDIIDVENIKETTELVNTITNKHELIPYNETGEITVKKVWDDNNDKYQRRPSSVTIRLFANDEEVDFITLNADNNWTYTFKDLPKYQSGKVGVEIVYTIKEDAVTNYETTIDGFTVTNTYNGPVETEITPPNTGIVIEMTTNKSFYELLMVLITLGYTITTTKKVEE